MNQLLIGLWGPVGVGKDSVADALGFPKASFAARLKQYLAPIMEDLGVDLAVREQKEKVRDLLVSLGATARRVDDNFWIKKVVIPNAPVVTFCDVRYWNEILSILFRGGVVYELTRPGFEPANDEEKRSFGQIRQNLADLGVSVPVILNTTPREACERIMDDLHERAANVYNNVWAIKKS